MSSIYRVIIWGIKTLRTPDERFRELPGLSFTPHYSEVADGDGGALRIHRVDDGPGQDWGGLVGLRMVAENPA